MEETFVSVIKYNCSVVHEEDDEFEVLRIEINDVKDNVKYDMVYQNIIVIIDFLMKYVNCYLDGDLGVVNIIGMEIKKPLAESVFEECILKSVPKDWRVVGKFKEDLLVSTKELKKKLIPCGLYDKKWECVYDIEKFYTQNRCHYFNEKAKEIMKRDLHSMIEVGTPYNPRNSLVESDEFLCCSISSNIPELIKLGENLISEMCDGPTENVNDLFKTYKGIFFNYGDFVAAYHQKLLETIPQQVALFYNNCKYLYRQLSEWDQMFETHDKLNEFCDDSSKAFYEVEEVGRVFFNSFVDEQKNQIEAILKQTNLQNKKTLDKLEDNTEKLLRQCLRQQELLKTVWSKVLSYPVYNETIGDIFSSMCTFLINALVKIEDIEAVVAENLIEIFKVVLNRGPKLFSDPNETSIYVPQWHKFNEVIFILGASLVDINDRWADGKGPLALHFKSYELKQLIRALFQNTDRRAAVLAKIHE
ncbi:hypothetical protein HHI36_018113 [Cryptolaemus montrouzieri]|uniref:Uncharacterized protein n=1 Tax=Cryptolaemus montrouzieri TaxID=559131 RepID=A0ABD2NZ62_9CUCU